MTSGESELYGLFERACALDEEGRVRFLAEVAARDAVLAAELRALLASDELDGSVPREASEPPRPGREGNPATAGASLDVERLRAEMAELVLRSRAGERYRVGEELGRGAMGRVRRVTDLPLRRELAMKTIRGDASTEEEPVRLARFLNEARILGRLSHPGIVSIHELGIDADGQAYFTMPIVLGGDLRDAFARSRTGQDGWSIARAVGVLQRVCEAMAYAHANGVVHRDLKPSNVMVGRFGEIQVMDWGVASMRGETDARDLRPSRTGDERTSDSPVRTMDGAILGTPFFMSPEQALGRAALVDERSDVYAVGAMLYELLAGRPPYEEPGEDSSPYAVLARLLEREPAPLAVLAPDAPAELIAIVEKAMARDPSARYAAMEVLAGELRAFLEGRVVRAYRTGAWEELVKWTRRNRALATASCGALLALVVGLATSMRLYVRAEGSAEEARRNAGEAEAERARAADNEASARREQQRAETETAKAKAIQHFLEGVISRANPTKEAADVRLRDVVLGAAAEIDATFPEQPAVSARLHLLLGECLSQLGEYERAEQHGRSALAALSEAGMAESSEAADAWYLCGVQTQNRDLQKTEELERGITALAESARIYRMLPGDWEFKALTAEASLAYLKQVAARSTQDLPEEFVQFVARAWKEDDLEVVRRRLYENVATITRLWEAGDRQGAKDFLRRDYAAHIGTAMGRSISATFLQGMGKLAVARERFAFAETSLELACDLVGGGDQPVQAAEAQLELAHFLLGRKRLDEAARLLAPAIEMLRPAYAPTHKRVVDATIGLATIQLKQSHYAEAEVLLARACAEARADPNVEPAYFLHELVLYSQALEGQGKHAEALVALEEADAMRSSRNVESRLTGDEFRIHRGRLLARSGRAVEAQEILAPLWEALEPAPPSATRSLCATALAVLRTAEGNQEAARSFDEESRRK